MEEKIKDKSIENQLLMFFNKINENNIQIYLFI